MISRAHQFRCVQCALIKFGQSSFARKTGSAVFDRGSIEVNIIIIANTEIAIEFGRVERRVSLDFRLTEPLHLPADRS